MCVLLGVRGSEPTVYLTVYVLMCITSVSAKTRAVFWACMRDYLSVCVCVCVSEQWTVLLFSTDTGSTSGDSSPVRVCVRACMRMHKCTINNHSIICSGILSANESQRTSRKTLPLTYSQSVLLTHYPICCLFVVVVVCLRTIYFKLNMMKQTHGQWGTINLTRTHSCEITARDNRVASVTLTDPVYTESSLWT